MVLRRRFEAARRVQPEGVDATPAVSVRAQGLADVPDRHSWSLTPSRWRDEERPGATTVRRLIERARGLEEDRRSPLEPAMETLVDSKPRGLLADVAPSGAA